MFPGAGNEAKTASVAAASEQIRNLDAQARSGEISVQKAVQEAEQVYAEVIRQQPYEAAQQLRATLGPAVAKILDASVAYQQFRIPGTSHVVVDQRETPPKGQPADAAKSEAKDAAKKGLDEAREKATKDAAESMALRDGRLVKQREKINAGYFGDRSMAHGALEREAAGGRVERMLAGFYKTLVGRFEQGARVARESADGKLHVLEKTLAQWREFFDAFRDRAVMKKISLSEIREFFLRGLIGKGEKGMVIGDLRLMSGRVEKFVRFSILADALVKLRAMKPGDTFGKGELGELTGEELMFLALAASRGREFVAGRLPTQGKFVDGRSEARAAEALGLPISAHLREKARTLRGKRAGLAGFGFGGEKEVLEEQAYRFVPWYHWGNLNRAGKLKWVTAAFYGTLFILALIGIATLTWRLLGGAF